MTFLRDINGTLGFTKIMLVYRAACDTDSTPSTPSETLERCDNSDEIFWLDDEDNERVGFFDGVVRRYGPGSPEAQNALNLGVKHGVGDDVTPL